MSDSEDYVREWYAKRVEDKARADLLAKVGGESQFPANAPGGYRIAYVSDDGELMCAECVNTESCIHFTGDNDGWQIIGYMAFGADTDYPETDEHCAHCNALIEEAYS